MQELVYSQEQFKSQKKDDQLIVTQLVSHHLSTNLNKDFFHKAAVYWSDTYKDELINQMSNDFIDDFNTNFNIKEYLIEFNNENYQINKKNLKVVFEELINTLFKEKDMFQISIKHIHGTAIGWYKLIAYMTDLR